MLFRILKKDLKRKKTMNIIIFIFVIMAGMFVASGLNNVITVYNGTDYFFDMAGVGDYNIMTGVERNEGELASILDGVEEIESYRIEDVIWLDVESVFKTDGSKAELSGGMGLIQSLDDCALKFFDVNNEEPTVPDKGHCYVTGGFIKDNDMQAGDSVRFSFGDRELTLVIDGYVKDALLGSEMIGNSRFLLNRADYEYVLGNEDIRTYWTGKVCYIDTEDSGAVDEAVTGRIGVMLAAGRSLITLTYVMNMIVAFIVLILSVCLVIVSFVILKFTISFTISEEYREIGVMKAIGIRNFKIRSLYLFKYMMIAVAGGVLGLVLSFPFGKLLIGSVSETMVLGNAYGVMPNIIGALVVVVLILLFSYKATGNVKKATPVDAIRSGQTGERYKKRAVLKLSKSRRSTPVFMAVNDVLSSPKRYMTIIVAFTLCTVFLMMLVNNVSTMKSDTFIETFAARSDLYVDALNMTQYMREDGKDVLGKDLDRIEEDLTARGIPCRTFIDLQYSYLVTCNGKSSNIRCQQGFRNSIDKYAFDEGTAPRNKNEVAITGSISEKIGAHIGDTITIGIDGEELECLVTAYFSTMNNGGELIRLHEDVPTNMKDFNSSFYVQIEYTDSPTEAVCEKREKTIRDIYGSDKVYTATEYQIDCMQVVPTMELVQILLLGITLIVVILMVILMERSFISNEKNEIAILKAVGFRDSSIIGYHVIRFTFVALMAVILAGILSIPFTYLIITPVFGLMGTTHVDFVINPVKLFLMYPAIILAVTAGMTFIVAQFIHRIKSRDISTIE